MLRLKKVVGLPHVALEVVKPFNAFVAEGAFDVHVLGVKTL